jgi:hypothetical protein
MSATIGVSMVPGQIALMRNPARRVLQSGAGGQPDHSVLRRVVRSPPRKSDEAAEGGAVDDGAAALGAHLTQLMLHARPHPAQVDRIDPVEDLGRLVGGIAGRDLDAGVVERHVEPAERVDGGPHHGRHAVLVGHVTPDADDPMAGGDQVFGGRTERGLVDVGDNHSGAGLGERPDSGQAHA